MLIVVYFITAPGNKRGFYLQTICIEVHIIFFEQSDEIKYYSMKWGLIMELIKDGSKRMERKGLKTLSYICNHLPDVLNDAWWRLFSGPGDTITGR